MLPHRLGQGAEDHAGLGQLRLEGGHHRHAVEHGVDGVAGGALHARQEFLLLQRDAQLGIGGQQFRIHLVQRLRPVLRLRRGVVIEVLIVDLRIVHPGPVGLVQGEPALIGLQPPVEQPLGLVLLGGDEADDVGVQPAFGELLLDVGDEAVGVLLPRQRRNGLDRVLIRGHQATSVRWRAETRAYPSSHRSAKADQWDASVA